MPPLTGIHFKYNNIIDLSCIISPSLVTDNVGFNWIKYECSLCHWQIDYEMKSTSVPCVIRELSWQNSCIWVPQSEWASHRHNFIVFMYLVYFSFSFRNGTILAVSQHIAIGIWRKVVWYTANDTPGNPAGIAHPYPPAHHADKNITWKMISGNNQWPTRPFAALISIKIKLSSASTTGSSFSPVLLCWWSMHYR